jgi:hypothetical protein
LPLDLYSRNSHGHYLAPAVPKAAAKTLWVIFPSIRTPLFPGIITGKMPWMWYSPAYIYYRREHYHWEHRISVFFCSSLSEARRGIIDGRTS